MSGTKSVLLSCLEENLGKKNTLSGASAFFTVETALTKRNGIQRPCLVITLKLSHYDRVYSSLMDQEL